tara:strand:- start:3632 stop:4003 length:372 start_codon:yes stop_codon:yes gene_type:complete
VKKNFYNTKKIKVIKNPNGNLFKLFSKNHDFFKKFGEIYYTEIHPNKFKGWKFHAKRTQVISVISGKVRFFLKKNEEDKPKIIDIESPNKLILLKIEPKTFYSFECKSKKKSILINIIDEIVK